MIEYLVLGRKIVQSNAVILIDNVDGGDENVGGGHFRRGIDERQQRDIESGRTVVVRRLVVYHDPVVGSLRAASQRDQEGQHPGKEAGEVARDHLEKTARCLE